MNCICALAGRRNELCLYVVGKGDAINCVFTLWGRNDFVETQFIASLLFCGNGMNCICTLWGRETQ